MQHDCSYYAAFAMQQVWHGNVALFGQGLFIVMRSEPDPQSCDKCLGKERELADLAMRRRNVLLIKSVCYMTVQYLGVLQILHSSSWLKGLLRDCLIPV